MLSLTVGVSALSGAAHAQGASLGKNIQTMTYEVYAGGINAVRAEFDMQYEPQKQSYKMKLSAWTKGFLGKLAPWNGSFETKGWLLKDGTKQPELHKSVSVWRDEKEVKEYNYAQDGKFLDYHVTEKGRDYTPEKLDQDLTQGTTDALSAALAVMDAVAENGQCEGRSEIFDGKRRYELVFRHESDEELTASRYNVFEGTAARCEVEVMPVAGAWHKKPRGWMSIQEQSRENGSLPVVWLGKITEDGPAVPVKIRVKTDYGTLFMHLVDYKNDQLALAVK